MSEEESSHYTDKRDMRSEEETMSFIHCFEEFEMGPDLFKKIQLLPSYETPEIKGEFLQIMFGSQPIVKKIIENIVEKASKKLYDKYLKKKVPKFVSENSLCLPYHGVELHF